MPIKGAIFVILVAVIFGAVWHDEINKWLKDTFSDNNKEEEK